jgi:SAM-dependent MidA family methyltransferase
MEDGRLREVFVTWDGARFVEELREPFTPELEAYFERVGLVPGEDCTAEVNLAGTEWMAQAGEALRRGFVLTFDYGYEAEELYAPWRKEGTLLCFYKHNPSGNPYARIGRQDMTSHVDFTSIRRSGEEAGLKTLGLVSQSDFLINLGISEAVPPGDGEIGLEEYLARRRAVSELLDPAGLGRIRVLAQVKGVDEAPLRGFASDA